MSAKWTVNEDSGCWDWNMYRDPNGYGRTGRSGDPETMAHRWAYEQSFGPIPDGMTVDHLCFNTACVNPAHLRLLSRSENAKNQRSATKTHCSNGHEFTPENTYIKPGARNGNRTCRNCQRAAVNKYREKKMRAA